MIEYGIELSLAIFSFIISNEHFYTQTIHVCLLCKATK